MTSKRNSVMMMGCWKGHAGGCRNSKRCGCSQERRPTGDATADDELAPDGRTAITMFPQ